MEYSNFMLFYPLGRPCPTLVVPNSNVTSLPGAVWEDEVDVECEEGFRMDSYRNTTFTATCGIDGLWQNHLTCSGEGLFIYQEFDMHVKGGSKEKTQVFDCFIILWYMALYLP